MSEEQEVVETDEVEEVTVCHRRSKRFGALATALAKAQGEFTTIKRGNTANIEGGKAQYSYKYAELSDFVEVARGPLSRHGLSVVQPPVYTEAGVVVVETILMHGESEQWMSCLMHVVPKDGAPQSVGSAITYARRYAYGSLLGLVAEKDDDDANAAQGNSATFAKGSGAKPQPHPKAPPKPAPAPAPAAAPEPPRRSLSELIKSGVAKAEDLARQVAGEWPAWLAAELDRMGMVVLEPEQADAEARKACLDALKGVVRRLEEARGGQEAA